MTLENRQQMIEDMKLQYPSFSGVELAELLDKREALLTYLIPTIGKEQAQILADRAMHSEAEAILTEQLELPHSEGYGMGIVEDLEEYAGLRNITLPMRSPVLLGATLERYEDELKSILQQHGVSAQELLEVIGQSKEKNKGPIELPTQVLYTEQGRKLFKEFAIEEGYNFHYDEQGNLDVEATIRGMETLSRDTKIELQAVLRQIAYGIEHDNSYPLSLANVRTLIENSNSYTPSYVHGITDNLYLSNYPRLKTDKGVLFLEAYAGAQGIHLERRNMSNAAYANRLLAELKQTAYNRQDLIEVIKQIDSDVSANITLEKNKENIAALIEEQQRRASEEARKVEAAKKAAAEKKESIRQSKSYFIPEEWVLTSGYAALLKFASQKGIEIPPHNGQEDRVQIAKELFQKLEDKGYTYETIKKEIDKSTGITHPLSSIVTPSIFAVSSLLTDCAQKNFEQGMESLDAEHNRGLSL